MSEDPDFLTVSQAKDKFGELWESDGPGKSYFAFAEPEGIWEPQYDDTLNLCGYRLTR